MNISESMIRPTMGPIDPKLNKSSDFLDNGSSVHVKMLLILFLALAFAQVILVYWKSRHYRSYQFWTLVMMAMAPLAISIYFRLKRFILVWSVYFFLTFLVYLKTAKSVISPTTPRQVYKWFLFAHLVTYFVACSGYLLVLMIMFGINLTFWLTFANSMDAGIHLLFYGIYFGTLGRDIAEMVTENMTTRIGFYNQDGLPKRILRDDICALCDNLIIDFTNPTGVKIENSIRATCGHLFHEFCLRGWNIIGKKNICPYCHEKIDPKKITLNLWEKPHVFYAGFLDFIRYSIAWQPLFLIAVQFVYWLLKFK